MDYGYWLFNGKCALLGKSSQWEDLPDGRVLLVKDPDEPAVLEDVDILYGLQNSQKARDDYNRLYPTLDVNSQARLDALLARNPKASQLVRPDQFYSDYNQHRSTTGGIRTRMPRRTP